MVNNKEYELIVPSLFGLEAFTAREIRRLGYETHVEDGRVSFWGDACAVCRSNIFLRTGERVLIKIGEFSAETFSELFDSVRALEWGWYIPKNAAFPVTGYSLKSTLSSVPSCQSIIKKAVVDSLMEYHKTQSLPEDSDVYQIRFSILKNRVTVMLDTSGVPLHKRGYRARSNAAPLRETIAAAMVMLSHWKYEYPLADMFCGSGTIPIEAAMLKRNIAPGVNRAFAAESFGFIDSSLWRSARDEARSCVRDVPLQIFASDTDPECVKLTRDNAELAGVGHCISVSQAKAEDFSSSLSDGVIITNPPYGERLGDRASCAALYKNIGKVFSALDNWSYFILAADERFETLFGRAASKKRKIYNGMLKCNVYQYFGKKEGKGR